MTNDITKKKLSTTLNNKFFGGNCGELSNQIADFILERDKKLVEPLQYLLKQFKHESDSADLTEAYHKAEEALSNAGYKS